MSAQHTPGPRDCGSIWLEARNAGDTNSCITFSTSTIDAGAEVHVMTGCLELERAVRLRNVPIKPHAVGALIVVSPNVSLFDLIAGWFRERGRARATIAKVTGSTS